METLAEIYESGASCIHDLQEQVKLLQGQLDWSKQEIAVLEEDLKEERLNNGPFGVGA